MKKNALYGLSATQILIIQIQPHPPQNTYTYIKNVEEKSFCPRAAPIR